MSLATRAILLLTALSASPPAGLFAQCPDGSPPPCRAPTAPRVSSADRTPSLSVLYLESFSADAADVALADGITEEVITRLSQVPGLRVTSRYAALRYRGRTQVDPRVAGREVGVRYVLQGTLRKSGDRVRVQVAMTDVASGFNTWAQTYDQPLREVFAMQDSVAVQVAEAVRGRLTRQERARLGPTAATNPAAYQAYLRGRAALRPRTAMSAAAGIAQYRQAIAVDPAFARAHAGLAQAFSLARVWGWEIPGIPQDSMDQLGLEAAALALALDSNSAESWLAAAMMERDRDPRRALDLHLRAVRLDSANVEVLHQLAPALYAYGLLDSALAVERRATARDPFYAYPYGYASWVLATAGRPHDALSWAAQGIAIDSTSGALHRIIADAYLQLGRTQDARASAERATVLGHEPAPMLAIVAIADYQDGDTAAAARRLESAAQLLRPRLARATRGLSFLLAFPIGAAYGRVGQPDSAVAWLRRIAPGQLRSFGGHLSRHPWWAPLRADPRFQRLVEESRPPGAPR